MAALSQHLRILLWKNWLSVKRQLVSVGTEECRRESLEHPELRSKGGTAEREVGLLEWDSGGTNRRKGMAQK